MYMYNRLATYRQYTTVNRPFWFLCDIDLGFGKCPHIYGLGETCRIGKIAACRPITCARSPRWRASYLIYVFYGCAFCPASFFQPKKRYIICRNSPIEAIVRRELFLVLAKMVLDSSVFFPPPKEQQSVIRAYLAPNRKGSKVKQVCHAWDSASD